jgi:NAD(P)H-hydrate epimerase
MNEFDVNDLKKLYVPSSSSHKGENGKLLIIGGSVLFHAASLWALQVASRIVDMVFYSSVPQNNELVEKEKEEFRNGIIVPRNKIDHYIEEADCILIGPGLPRENGVELGDDDTKELTERLFKAYPNKKWVVDGGSLQTIKPETIPHNAILTPHHGEFFKLFESRIKNQESRIKNKNYILCRTARKLFTIFILVISILYRNNFTKTSKKSK